MTPCTEIQLNTCIGQNVHSLIVRFRGYTLLAFLGGVFILGICSCDSGSRWLKGNMHTHTLWSDGDEFPEKVTGWYKANGYDFLAITDHNILQEGEKWRRFPESDTLLLQYLEDYGNEGIEVRQDTANEGFVEVKLKTLDEFRSRYEEPGRFLLIKGNEISCKHAVHLTGFNQDEVIPPAEGSPEERSRMIREVVRKVYDYRASSGLITFPVLAHPNFRWAITAEMMMEVPELRFFEVYNGHPQVNNDGDIFRASTERIWDIVLAGRISGGNDPLYALATDDAHRYHGGGAGPGRGWIMIKSRVLSPQAILQAMENGDFYASTGVTVEKIKFNGKTIKVEIKPVEGARYLTEFIGTLKGFDPSGRPTTDSTGLEIPNTTRVYSNQIGKVLASSEELRPSYTFSGDELYVRIRITSTLDHIDPLSGIVLGKQKAWLQPITGK